MPKLAATSLAPVSPASGPASATAEVTSGLASMRWTPHRDADVGQNAVEALHDHEADHHDVAVNIPPRRRIDGRAVPFPPPRDGNIKTNAR